MAHLGSGEQRKIEILGVMGDVGESWTWVGPKAPKSQLPSN